MCARPVWTASVGAGLGIMTPRQALNILVWVVLLPITIGIWAQFLPPCALGCVPKNQERVPPP